MTSVLPNASQPRPYKRKFQSRASQACDMCRIKKAKCDQGRPCRTCQDREFTCVYSHVSARRPPAPYSPPSRFGASQPLNENGLNSVCQPEVVQEKNIRESSTIPREHGVDAAVNSTIEILHNSIGPSDALEEDTISAINQHTSGTEFYGQSSNIVLLNQLLFKARAQVSIGNSNNSSPINYTNREDLDHTLKMQKKSLPTKDKLVANTINYERGTRINNARPPSTPPSTSPMSIVSILYDENSTMTEAVPATQLTVAGRAQKSAKETNSSHQYKAHPKVVSQGQPFSYIPEPDTVDTPPVVLEHHTQDTVPTSLRRANDPSNDPACFFGRPMLLEAEYIDLYFKNIHYIHPFLDPAAFKGRCEREIWVQRLVKQLRRDQMHFVALYNAVLAVGALTAGTDLLLDFRADLEKDQETGRQGKPPTSRRLSQLYFQRCRRLLGDVFEVCSIESSQTLLLMSIYCQYALRPHASYMYSGMAVRNALAIGLPSDKNSNAESVRRASKKTWFCIFGQEIEISCASGRLSSLSNAADYQVLLQENDSTGLDEFTQNEACILIISEIAKLSVILYRASTELYHYPKHISLQKKSDIAIELDKQLDSWMTHLPSWLNPNSSNLKELEWENKQKLNLNIRFYVAKMFLHRPFITNSTTNAELLVNIDACLKAAQKTIKLLYSAYKHRYYVRTWWYNATYTLYASVILLHVVLLDCTQISASELLQDVRKGLKVLQAMEEMDVARRSAELVGEILKVAEKKVSASQVGQARDNAGNDVFNGTSNDSGDFTQPQAFHSNNFGSNFNSTGDSNFEDAINVYSSDMTEVSSARGDILAGFMGQEILEGFGTGFNNLMLIDLEGPISDTSFGIRSEYAMFDNSNDENSGCWVEGI